MKSNSLPFFLCLFIFGLNLSSVAVDRYWVGGGSDNFYNNGANWNTASNGTGTSGAPVNTDNIIIDRNATIEINGVFYPSSLRITNNALVQFTTSSTRTYTIGGGSVSPAFVIEAGAQLEVIGTAALTLELYNGSAAIYGILDFSGTNSKMNADLSGTTTTVKSGGTIRYGGNSANGTGTVARFIMEENSTYEIYKNGGTFPTGNYHPNSLCSNTGAISTAASFAMSSIYGSYGDYQFDSPGYSGSGGIVNANIIFDEVSILNTGSGRWVYSTSPSIAYTMTVKGNFDVSADAIFEINGAGSGSQSTVIKVEGNVNIDGVVTETGNNNGSVIELAGSQDADFYCHPDGMTNDISLAVNKTGGALVNAIADVYISESDNARLILTSGVFDMTGAVATMIIRNPVPGAVVGGSISSHIVGPMRRFSNQIGAYTFPVSNLDNQLAKASITTASNSPTEWTVEFEEPNFSASTGLTPGTIDQVSNYYWNIQRDGVTPSDASNITLTYSDLLNPFVVTASQLKVVYFDGVIWQNLGGSVNAGTVTNSLGSNGSPAPADHIIEFGDFALGGILNTLPVDIDYLTGRRSGKKHDLTWKVNCSSVSTVNMILERSVDARNFSSIHILTVDPDRCQQSFSYSDENPLPGINFYRLAVKDIDGRYKYSRIISLLNPADRAALSAVYPNPASGPQVMLDINAPASQNAELMILDNQGRTAGRKKISLMTGLNKIPLDISALAPGQYQIVMLGEDNQKTVLRFIRTR